MFDQHQSKNGNPNHIIGLEKNCMSCAYTQNNEATLKAFKMACLTYKPSPVAFENT